MDKLTQPDPSKRLLMANVINLMMVACTDGKISPEEQNLINEIAQSYGLTDEEIDYCAQMCNQGIKEGTVVVQVPDDDEAKIQFLTNLVVCMMSDGEISDSESQYVAFMAEKFGFEPQSTVEALVNAVYRKFKGSDSEPEDDREALKRELEQIIPLGKEALMKNDVPTAFDYLFRAAHLDKEAYLLFLMIPEIDKRLYLLTEEQVEQLEDAAGKGSALAQYTLGRYHQVVQPEADSSEKARDLFIAAGKAGMGDPLAAIAMMLITGQLDMEIDKDRYYQGLEEAWNKGSMIGGYHIYKAAILGLDHFEANPQAVIDNIKQWLNGNESEDLQEVNPTYYEVLALAYSELGDRKTAADYYLKCARMGRVDLYYQYTLLHYFNDDLELLDAEGYEKDVETGIALGCPYSYALRSELNQQRFDESTDPKEKEYLSNRIAQDLFEAGQLGEGYAIYILGLYWYYGSYGFTQDDNTAWGYFLDASAMNVAEAWTMMGEMYLDQKAPAELGPHFITLCRLMAYRLGDEDMLIPLIVSYRGGYLDKYKNEVEKYYLPAYEALSDEEKTAFFGMKFIGAVGTDGQANLIEFDFETEDWSELEEIADARKLEAIHTDQLDQIGRDLDLEGRLTAWVDSDRQAKNLQPNVLGNRFSTTPVLGDIVFTLEDEDFHPLAIDLGLLKQVIALLNGKVAHVFYDEFPDDDSHNDPHA